MSGWMTKATERGRIAHYVDEDGTPACAKKRRGALLLLRPFSSPFIAFRSSSHLCGICKEMRTPKAKCECGICGVAARTRQA